jgi:hypothetical protein
MYYRIQTTKGTEPEIFVGESSALYQARLRFDDDEFAILPYTLPERLESALDRLWRADANGAAATMSDLFDGYDAELLASEIESTLERMQA